MAFRQKPAGFYPFWFWNDHLQEDEIRWQIKEMHDQGVKGFFIHPRQGLKQPYLSHAFFQVVDTAIACAEQYGMEVHLYDEYPYPSGVAGGEVILGNPQYYATSLVQDKYDVEGGDIRLVLPQGKILSVIAYPLRGQAVDWSSPTDLREYVGMVLTEDSYIETGLTAYNQKRYFASNPVPVLETSLPNGNYRIFVSAQQKVDKFKYWDNYVDVLNPDAIREFIRLTHERYKQRYADRFGSTIFSIFVDETTPQWSDRIPQEFLREYGYDLCPLLPALQDKTHPDHVKVSYDLYNLKYKLFCESFEEPISSWCQENGIAYSGEKPGLKLSQIKYMDIPGCDPGHRKAGGGMDIIRPDLRKNAKAVASVAHFLGKSGSLCECYHSLGWSGTLQDAKLIGEGLLLLGVNHLVPHGFFYTTHGLKKHDAPPSFFFQMPYWPLFGRLSERIERLNAIFDGTHIDADVFLVDAHSGLPTMEQKSLYGDILLICMENHLDFHIVDTEILQAASIQDGQAHLQGVSAKAVIVPPMQVVEQPLQDWLEAFQQAGGRVIDCTRENEREVCQGKITASLTPSLSIQDNGQEVPGIWSVKRITGERALWFLLNTTDQEYKVTLQAGSKLQEIEIQEACRGLLQDQGDHYQRTIRPFESLVLAAADQKASSELAQDARLELSMSGECEISALNKNLLRMYEWQMTLLDDHDTPLETAAVPAIPLSNQLEYGQFRFSPEYHTYFGHAPELDWPELKVSYEYTFTNAYSGPVELVMEPDTILGDWEIAVNGNETFGAEALADSQAHVRGSQGVDITRFLRQGKNVIQVRVAAAKHSDGLINALYLAGDFGVKLHPTTLVEPKRQGLFEVYADNLLPYYAGVIEYRTTWELAEVPTQKSCAITLHLGEHFREAAEVSINGSKLQPVLWEPRTLQIETNQLQRGKNDVTIRVYTSLSRSFEGEWFDYQNHKTRQVKMG